MLQTGLGALFGVPHRANRSAAWLVRSMNNSLQFDESTRVLFERELTLTASSGDILRPVKIAIYEALPIGGDWIVWFEIRGLLSPSSIYRFNGVQVDPLGAFITALHHLALNLMTSVAYRTGHLFWLEPGDQCGLPLPKGYENL